MGSARRLRAEGCSLHAKFEIEAHDRDALERLCRYQARIATEALAVDWRVVCALRRDWKGRHPSRRHSIRTTSSPVSRLVPRRRAHLLTYQGVLGSKLLSAITSLHYTACTYMCGPRRAGLGSLGQTWGAVNVHSLATVVDRYGHVDIKAAI